MDPSAGRAGLLGRLRRLRLACRFGLRAAQRSGGAAAPGSEAPAPGSIAITQDDIDWFRRSSAEWIACESGAPAIVPPELSLEQFGEALDGGSSRVSPLFDRFVKVTSAFFLHASFAPGHYGFVPPFGQRAAFDVTAEHIRLLQHANWRTFMIDCKRPYGDFTHYQIDMADILGLPVAKDAKGHAQIGRDAEQRMDALHADMLYALQAYIRFAHLARGDTWCPSAGCRKRWGGRCAGRCRPRASRCTSARCPPPDRTRIRGARRR
jgi:hypothetical protein